MTRYDLLSLQLSWVELVQSNSAVQFSCLAKHVHIRCLDMEKDACVLRMLPLAV